MRLCRCSIFILFLTGSFLSFGQSSGFDSFISRVSSQYKIDVAIAPELIPTLDSIRHVGPQITTIDELLYRLLNHSGITYQIVDGNKLMLRREHPTAEHQMLAVVYGTIVDAKSREPIPYATVIALQTNKGCVSDESGNFILPVTDTSGNIQISYLGYKSIVKPLNSFLKDHSSVQLEINKIPLKEVTIIVPYRLIAQDYSGQSTDLTGYQFISEQQLLTWNTERLISGLTTYTHYSSDQGIRIRGTEAGNSLIIMDNIIIYNPYHFYNIFPPFNGKYFSSVDVYKNNLPIEYGGRIDGMVRLASEREQPSSKLILDTDLLQSSLTGELTLSPKIYLTAGGRVSHTGILNKALSDSSVTNFRLPGTFRNENEWATSQQPTTDFYDINLGLAVQSGEESQISFHYFGSRDVLDNITHSDFEVKFLSQEVISVQQNYSSNDEWKNGGLSAGFRTGLSEKTSLHLLALHSIYDKDVSYTSKIKEVRQGMTRFLMLSGFLESHLTTSGIKGFIRQTNDPSSAFSIGIDLQRHKVDFRARENNFLYLTQDQQETEITGFGEYSGKLWSTFDWAIGSRVTYLRSTSGVYALPNARLHYAIHDHFSLRTSFSKNLQAVQELTVENRFGRELGYMVLSEPEEAYPVLKSDKYMIGAGYNATYLSVDVEGYYKAMDGLTRVRPLRPDPSADDPTSPNNFYRLFVGEGWTSGLDITVLYKKKKIEASLLYTLSKIAERYDQLFNGNYFSPQEDRRHQVKASAICFFGRFQLSTLLTYKSKAPYLSLVRLEGRDGIGMVDQGAVLRYLPPYFSLDLGFDYSFSFFKQPAMIGISLINATNHENIYDLQHIGRIPREGSGGIFLTNRTELLGRTANVHFRYLID